MKGTCISAILFTVALDACSQSAGTDNHAIPDRKVGGPCEGCEAVFEYAGKKLTSTDTLPDFKESGAKLEISGTIFQMDGKTPAKGVILYIYHTDQKGEYSNTGNEAGWTKRHGDIRGWVRTNADGKYKFYTLKPAPYPGGGNPSHIHPIVKEPGVEPYWIDEYLFEGDPYITEADRRRLPQRGGQGLLKATKRKDGMLVVRRDITLGLNVPGYAE